MDTVRICKFFKKHQQHDFYTMEDVIEWDNKTLVYHIATLIYDTTNNLDDSLSAILPEIKKTFPDIYVDILEGYVLGEYDT